ncbi:peroxide stress protein YaaA [Ferrovum myxofaciens]|uniref:peroxide stress protein YaaA n=1 Tax=Ferrovum myxofaciens TaxID=416213 RepID=UPI00123772C0|nr:peroxide stress protein YaaA [Ferrovum myxofaciens]MBU6993720.1 peroxide stress protein YaaA [Ferrovum myxofaciens]
MVPRLGADWLLIIPCCARKIAGGELISVNDDPLIKLVTHDRYSAMINTRRAVMQSVFVSPRFANDKNTGLKDGVDFGGHNMSGLYMPALARYDGTLYRTPCLNSVIKHIVETKGMPQIMILSALYGPLHPLSPIQNYNLKMEDAPARAWEDEFPVFLEDFVRRNGVKKIGLYLGSSTKYLKVAKKAVDKVCSSGTSLEVVQYHIVDGSTHKTPSTHGLRMLYDLGGPSLYDPAQICEKFFLRIPLWQ